MTSSSWARDRARLEDVSDELIATYQVKVEILPADLGDREQLQRVANRLADPGRTVVRSGRLAQRHRKR